MGLLRTVLLTMSIALSPVASDAAPQPPASPLDELAEHQLVIDGVKTAIHRKDYKALNAMARVFRTQRSRTGSGIWKLSIFHSTVLAELGAREGPCEERSADFLEGWIAAAPAEPAPYITRAAVIEEQAWCLRGRGLADSVSQPRFEAFAAKVDEARKILDEHRKTASIDPHYYTLMERILIDQGADKAEFKRLLDEATAREPDYHYLYFAAFRYFQPQWYGSHAEVDEIARYAAARTADTEGLGMYARFYWFALECGCSIRESIDWPTMKSAMRDVMSRYPSDWNAANFVRISCSMSDPDEAVNWFDRVKGDYTAAWSNQEEMQSCERMVKWAKGRGKAVAEN
jgi:hypothetical protein